MSSFTTIGRFIEDVTDVPTSVDVLVIGGGITGAAVAYDAALRGLRVALVEERDFGGATSAATGKLIHGGLRYLKQFEIGLVRESLRERRNLSNIAPNLIDIYPTVLPDADLIMRIGLTAYDVLSFDRNKVIDPAKKIPRHQRYGKNGLLYHDCLMISPERLTLAFVRSAAAHGALISNHTRASELIVESDSVVGAKVLDLLDNREHEVRAKVVVNATGPWAFDVLDSTKVTAGTAGNAPSVRSEGIYLITRKLTDVMTLNVTPNGHFSIAPWRGHSMIGPTEKNYSGAVSDWKLTRESVEKFMRDINDSGLLPEPIGFEDVLHAYGGLRPLTEDVGENTYEASRRAEVVDHASPKYGGIKGLVTAAGGKYTTSRAFADHVMRLVLQKLGRAAQPSRSHEIALNACDTGPIEDFVAASQARNSDFSVDTIRYLARHHGTEHEAVLELARQNPHLAQVLDADGELLAQVLVAARHESARMLLDVLLRRTGLGTLGHPGPEVLAGAAEVMAKELAWTEERKQAEIAAADAALTLPWLGASAS